MLGHYASSTSSTSDSRLFIYEVTNLSENEVTLNHRSPIRTSDSQFIQVPFHRMGEEMQRITSLGGKIVAIRPFSLQPE